MNILGISAYYHDSASVLLSDGRIVAAAQEERFTRKKHDERFPHYALEYCLKESGLALSDLDFVVFYDKPFLKFERLLETSLAVAPHGFKTFATSMLPWLKDKLFLKKMLLRELARHGSGAKLSGQLLFSEHHLSHAASAFFPSPFERAAILTMDGVGEWTTSSVARGCGRELEILEEIHFPHSLGLLYSAFTYYTGFKVNSGEYKLMGLAPYGVPRYAGVIREHLIDLKQDGSFRLNMEYFDYLSGFTMTNDKFAALFGGPARGSDQPLDARHMDLAASIQAVTEEVLLAMTRSIARETGEKNFCLAGGVALNCVANGKILRDRAFENIWIQPAAGDAGGALGAALAVHHLHCDQPRVVTASGCDAMQGGYLGPAFSQAEIENRLKAMGAIFHVESDASLLERCASDLAQEKAVGWFQGRMEFGPRALGGRSILGDPRSPAMQSQLNLKVKFRESFRPFAPSVLSEDAHLWFGLREPSPYMLLVADVVPGRRREMSEGEQQLFGIDKLNVVRSEVPAVTHVDYSARIQTVHRETNPRYHALITLFKDKTGCPMLVNTSFNVRGEPIVCTPEDAFRCFMGTDMDALAIGNCYLEKERQDPKLKLDYRSSFELD
jgi:carbamoyltransferase